MVFLLNSHGRPFTANGFGNRVRERCDEAGLPECSSHSLRKLIATRLAENGGTENEISAILGWTNNGQASLYTAAANREKLARSGMNRTANGTHQIRESVHTEIAVVSNPEKPIGNKGDSR